MDKMIGINPNPLAKIQQGKDICKDAAFATGVLRNSITYYVRELEHMGLLRAVCRKRDRNTGYMAKHYSADKGKWSASKHGNGKEVRNGI